MTIKELRDTFKGQWDTIDREASNEPERDAAHFRLLGEIVREILEHLCEERVE